MDAKRPQQGDYNMSTKEWIQTLRKFSTATIYEAAGKLGGMEPHIRCIVSGLKMVGPAFTVKCLVGDARAVAQAIDRAAPGDVLVVDSGGTDLTTPFGSMSATAAKLRGIAGFVTNGAVRDFDELVEIGFPVFAAGISVRGNVKQHPGWIGIPITVGGVTVRPRDIIVGDPDGVVVVPVENADQVCSKAVEQQIKEDNIMQRIRSGERMTKIFGIE
jgi:4-hydroxy-4-methyl-2-oxoglutarate aldolase